MVTMTKFVRCRICDAQDYYSDSHGFEEDHHDLCGAEPDDFEYWDVAGPLLEAA